MSMPPTLLSPPQSFDEDAWSNATTTTTSAKDGNPHAVMPFPLVDGEPVTTVAVLPLQAAEANVADVEAPASPAGRHPSSTIRGSARANLRASVADGSTWGGMGGVGESYLAAFALAVGMGEIAAGFRFWSVVWLLRHQAPLARRSDLQPARERNLSNNAARSRAITGGRLLTYLVVVQAMVQISGPYFAPYMLKQLEFNYHQFVIVLAVGFVAKIVGLWWWGRGQHSGGTRRLLWIGGVGIVPLSALWIVSDRFEYLLRIQVASGLTWAAYELEFFLLFFETLPLHKRTRMLTGITLQAIPVLRIGLGVLGVRLSTSTIDIPILSTSDRPS